YGIRMLVGSPGLTAAAVITLALGTGANTAIFSLMDHVLLRQLPVQRPEELVILRSPGPRQGHTWSDGDDYESFTYAMYKGLRDNNTAFSGLLARVPAALAVASGGETEETSGELVSGNYFEMLGVRPELGRLLTQEDDLQPGAHPIAVISHGYWVRRFAANPAILNQTLSVNGHALTIVGVSQKGFTGIQVGQQPDIFIPLMMKAQMTPFWNGLDNPKDYFLVLMGRVKSGLTREQAEASVNTTYAPLLEEAFSFITGYSEQNRQKFLSKKIELEPASRGRATFQRDAQTPLIVLMAMVGLVLIIACSNVASLLIARGAARQREFAIRLALGASRWVIIRQLLVESLIYSIAGGTLGLLVATWTIDLLLGIIPREGDLRGLTAGLDLRVLAFSGALSLLTGVLFGLAPALRGSRPDLQQSLKDQSGSVSTGSAMLRLRKILVISQIAITLVLLVGAGLFGRSLRNLGKVDLGMEPSNLVEFAVSPELTGYSPQATAQFSQHLTESLAAQPGVQSVTASEVAAFTGSDQGSNMTVEGYQTAPDESIRVNRNHVGRDYFSTMGIPLVSGREFTFSDNLRSKKVAIISESVAQRYFSGRDPVGWKLIFSAGTVKPDIEIVGVVKDARHHGVANKPTLMVYQPYLQDEQLGSLTFYIRTTQPLERIASGVRQEVQRLDPSLPVVGLKTLETQINESLYGERIVAFLSIGFAGLAALLATVGIYGVLAYSVVQRTREVGLRIALGAQSADIWRLIFRDVALMLGIGAAIGAPLAYVLAKLIEGQLFDVRAADLPVFLAGAALIVASGLLAGYVPTRRATKVDPITALRCE
ncbi:MAG TPA: ABC transporter permease, partial [Blastocatellia bacterium]|nr:ABC transporter permease [Blastocatellia bacterium]